MIAWSLFKISLYEYNFGDEIRLRRRNVTLQKQKGKKKVWQYILSEDMFVNFSP